MTEFGRCPDGESSSVRDRIDNVQFRGMATLEISPDNVVAENGFPFPKSGSTIITQDDFPAIIAAIVRAANAKLGAGIDGPAALPDEHSRSAKGEG